MLLATSQNQKRSVVLNTERKKHKDKYGRVWSFLKNELCPICGQPDNCGDCNHERLTNSDVKFILTGR